MCCAMTPGRCCVKLLAPYRMAGAQTRFAAAPDRIIRDSHYPYRSNVGKVTGMALFDPVARRITDAATRRKMLVGSPLSRFKFIQLNQ